VVRHGVDDDRRAADAVTLVADLLVAHALEVAGGLVDVALDGVGRHVGRLGLVDRQPQARVGRQIAAALARRHHDFTDDARPDLAALLVLAPLAVLDVRPFAVSGHGMILFCSSALISLDPTFYFSHHGRTAADRPTRPDRGPFAAGPGQ